MQIRLGQIAEMLGASVDGSPDVMIYGASKIEEGKAGTITFLANPKYTHFIYDTLAAAVIVDRGFKPENPLQASLLRVDNVYMALSVLMAQFQDKLSIAEGISPDARIDPSAVIGEESSVDAQVIIQKGVVIGKHVKVYGQVFIGNDCEIGDHTILFPGVKLYHRCKIGARCIIHANAVLGSDGFGFAKDASGNFQKIPQTGNVVVEDDVEIGANTVIDRASLGSTVIEAGAKLDNLIQIAHNVQIGRRTAIAAQTGVAGSTRVGADCMIGGQTGIVGHLTLADKLQIQAQSGIAASIQEEGSKWYGTPAIPYRNYLKSYAKFTKLSEMSSEIDKLKKDIEQLQSIIDDRQIK
jgi:UDP-3-O-[3-hydroxymyristoyl] glucosamine N-acyltransferase